jgi:dienelactone hydrolase
MRSRRRLLILLVVLVTAGGLLYTAAPYARAASLVIRAAKLGGRVETFARDHAYAVTRAARVSVPTRSGDVAAQFYVPDTAVTRTVLLIPGVHSMGIQEPRLTALAEELAGSGVRVMAMALPDLQRYRITAQSTDVIEDAVHWLAGRPEYSPDGRVGIVGISFAGGLSISAAGRPAIRDKVAFVVSFGGHGDLRRVLHYIATGEAPAIPGITVHPPHDYAASVVLYGLADRGIVPADQVQPLRDGIETFLLASQLTLVDMNEANATFAKAKEMQTRLPEPAAAFMGYVNNRDVKQLGPRLVPFLNALDAGNPALSPQYAMPPSAPIYLLHGDGDTVIPTAESRLLGDALVSEGARVQVLLSSLITHAEVNRAATTREAWQLVSFWGSVLRN